MCSTPPAMATSYAPKRDAAATAVVTAVIAPAHIRSTAKPGTDLRQAGEQRGGPADRQALVAGLGGRGDRDLVDPLRGQRRVAAQQVADDLTTRSSARVSA